jgi:hypothetical protein
MEIMIIFWWLVFLVLATWYGSKRKLGGGWTFLISLILSPLIVFIAELISYKKE